MYFIHIIWRKGEENKNHIPASSKKKKWNRNGKFMTRELTRMSPLFRLLSNLTTKKSAVELQIQFYKFEKIVKCKCCNSECAHIVMKLSQRKLSSESNFFSIIKFYLGHFNAESTKAFPLLPILLLLRILGKWKQINLQAVREKKCRD